MCKHMRMVRMLSTSMWSSLAKYISATFLQQFLGLQLPRYWIACVRRFKSDHSSCDCRQDLTDSLGCRFLPDTSAGNSTYDLSHHQLHFQHWGGGQRITSQGEATVLWWRPPLAKAC